MDRRTAYVLLAASLLAPGVSSAQLAGRAVSVADGDTLTILVDTRKIRVRLADIDAPELRQPYGQRAKQALSRLCYARRVEVLEQGHDRNGRVIGSVRCAGIDAGAEQVRHGMAWVFTRYAPPDSPLYRLEHEARAAQRGLWAASDAVPPWAWRSRR